MVTPADHKWEKGSKPRVVQNGFPKLLLSLAFQCRVKEDGGICGNEGVAFEQLFAFFALGSIELVAFGCYHHEGEAALAQIRKHHFVILGGTDTAVYKLDHKL